VSKPLNRAVNILFVVLVLLALGWIGGAIANWDQIVNRPVRLAYIICDFLIVIPLGFIAGIGLKQGKLWAPNLFVLTLGALLFDIAHGVFVQIWDPYFGVHWLLMMPLLVVVVVYIVYAVRALEREKEQQVT
jgi:peptidoglycan/LPS O-acetylase OafA/YrhL